MRRILDWTLSSIDDDVSAFTNRLTTLEMQLFHRGASAAAAHAAWKIGGSRRIAVSGMALRSAAMGHRAAMLAAAGGGQTRDEEDGDKNGGRTRAVTPDGIAGKRMRVLRVPRKETQFWNKMKCAILDQAKPMPCQETTSDLVA